MRAPVGSMTNQVNTPDGIDAAEFSRVLRHLPTGVTVINSLAPEERHDRGYIRAAGRGWPSIAEWAQPPAVKHSGMKGTRRYPESGTAKGSLGGNGGTQNRYRATVAAPPHRGVRGGLERGIPGVRAFTAASGKSETRTPFLTEKHTPGTVPV